MLERLNPLLRIICIALAGLVLYQASQMTLRKDVVARSAFEAPLAATRKTDAATNTTTASTNAASTNATAAAKTNAVPPTGPSSRRPPSSRMPGMPGMGGPANVPAEIQAVVDKIKQSQVLGIEMKPPPMALIGIAGKDVFIRGPMGQDVVLREGEENGGVKLLRIGVNRVLVEENGQQKELTLFNGLGSETLLPQKKDKSEPPQ